MPTGAPHKDVPRTDAQIQEELRKLSDFLDQFPFTDQVRDEFVRARDDVRLVREQALRALKKAARIYRAARRFRKEAARHSRELAELIAALRCLGEESIRRMSDDLGTVRPAYERYVLGGDEALAALKREGEGYLEQISAKRSEAEELLNSARETQAQVVHALGEWKSRQAEMQRSLEEVRSCRAAADRELMILTAALSQGLKSEVQAAMKEVRGACAEGTAALEHARNGAVAESVREIQQGTGAAVARVQSECRKAQDEVKEVRRLLRDDAEPAHGGASPAKARTAASWLALVLAIIALALGGYGIIEARRHRQSNPTEVLSAARQEVRQDVEAVRQEIDGKLARDIPAAVRAEVDGRKLNEPAERVAAEVQKLKETVGRLEAGGRRPAVEQPASISPDEARKRVGESVVLRMAVLSSKPGANGVHLLNSRGDFTKADNFTVVIPEAVWSAYEKKSGRAPEITKIQEIVVAGKVEERQGKPQIRVNDMEQIYLVRP